MSLKTHVPRAYCTLVLLSLVAPITHAQQSSAPKDEKQPTPAPAPARRGGGNRGPTVKSPEVQPDRKVTFRILAPKAESVRLNAGDLPGGGPQQPRTLTKGENGIWELTLGPVDPGTYRYVFDVDGVSVVDPRSNAVSESNNNTWSVVHVPGSEFADEKEVPHGAVAAVHYKSSALGRDRRMHVYTPPGYETSQDKYPVFYLLHGAGDCDDSWTSVGRANFILDNLIAAGKAKPMVVVMPAGHTGPFGFGAPPPPSSDGRPNLGANSFEEDFVKDVMPYVEKHYRVLTDRPNTAIAGLSMGGLQTLEVAIPRLERFAYVGVYSSGLIGAFPNAGGRGAAPAAAPTAPAGPVEWEKMHAAKLDDANLKKGLRLLWFGTGKEDFLLSTTNATVDLFKRHGFSPVFVESPGAHTWINWRNYLSQFAPQLFRSKG